jgi:hypothetical protein
MAPGSFFEFIQREPLEAGVKVLDLAFGSGNARGTFKMTSADRVATNSVSDGTVTT